MYQMVKMGQCNYCEAEFDTEKQLREHLTSVHQSEVTSKIDQRRVKRYKQEKKSGIRQVATGSSLSRRAALTGIGVGVAGVVAGIGGSVSGSGITETFSTASSTESTAFAVAVVTSGDFVQPEQPVEGVDERDMSAEDVQPMDLGEDVRDTLAAELGGQYSVDTVPDDEMIDNVDEFDVWVLHNLGAGADDLGNFLDALEPRQGTVFLENITPSSNGISQLAGIRDGLEVGIDTAGQSPVQFELLVDDELFEGVGSAGDVVDMYDIEDDLADRAWFNGYDGEILAEVTHSQTSETDGPCAGIDTERNEVLLSLGRIAGFAPDENFTDEANTLLGNAVRALTLAPSNAVQIEGEDVTLTNTTVRG